jgi:Rieske Fe-S protein
MNPDAATIAAGAPVEFDLSKVEPGQQTVVRWRERQADTDWPVDTVRQLLSTG